MASEDAPYVTNRRRDNLSSGVGRINVDVDVDSGVGLHTEHPLTKIVPFFIRHAVTIVALDCIAAIIARVYQGRPPRFGRAYA